MYCPQLRKIKITQWVNNLHVVKEALQALTGDYIINSCTDWRLRYKLKHWLMTTL